MRSAFAQASNDCDERVDACPRAVRSGSRFAAVHRHDGAEREAVDVEDLAGLERASRLRPLRSRSRESPRAASRIPPRPRSRWRRARRCGSARATSPAADDQIAGADVGAAAADVVSGGGRREDLNRRCPDRAVSSTITTASAPAGSGAPVAISAQVPGAMRDRATAVPCRSDRDDAAAPAARGVAPARVRGDDRVAVHGRPRERRHVDRRGRRRRRRRARPRPRAHALGARDRTTAASSRRRASSREMVEVNGRMCLWIGFRLPRDAGRQARLTSRRLLHQVRPARE